MNLFTQSMTCNICNKLLKSPIILPCGITVCNSHIHKRKIYCEKCDLEHEEPNNGFIPNLSLENMISTNLNMYDFGPEYKDALNSCIRIECLVDQFRVLYADPDFYIDGVFGDFRDQIDIKRESLKNFIDKEAHQLIEQTYEVEKFCVNQAKTNVNPDEFKSIDLEKETNGFSALEKINIIDGSQGQWRAFSSLNNLRCVELEKKLNHLKRSLLMGQFNTYNEKVFAFKQLDLTPSGFKIG